jgi:5S rRNA maturation endonuclease (ribonuclease M5)
MYTINQLKSIVDKFFHTKTTIIGNDWIKTNCPFAQYTHAKRSDSNPSFGLSIQGGYNCFSCGKKGTLWNLAADLANYTHIYNFKLEQYIRNLNKTHNNSKTIDTVKYLDKSILKVLKPAKPVYNLTNKDIEKWNIKYYPMLNDIVYPLMDYEKNLLALINKHKTITSFKLKTMGFLFGEQFTHNTETVILVEGLRDTVFLQRYNLPVLGTLGNPSEGQLKKLREVKNVILFFDNDESGFQFKKKAIDVLLGYVNLKEVTNYYGVKDGAEAVEKGKLLNIIKSIKGVF